MQAEQLKPNVVLRGPLFPEPVQVIVAVPLGEAVKVIAKGLRTIGRALRLSNTSKWNLSVAWTGLEN